MPFEKQLLTANFSSDKAQASSVDYPFGFVETLVEQTIPEHLVYIFKARVL